MKKLYVRGKLDEVYNSIGSRVLD